MPHDQDPHSMAIAQNLQNPEQYGDYLRSQADFLQTLTEAMEAVHSSEDPERTQYDFEFFFGGSPPELPPSISDYCGSDLQQASLTLAKESGEAPTASLELHFTDKNNRPLTFYISRDPTLLDTGENDVVLVGKNAEPQEVERVPRSDLNALVLSFVTGQQTVHAANMQDVDIFSAESHEVLLDALQRSATSWRTHLHYTLAQNRDLRWSTASNGSSEILSACQFTYETGVDSGRKVVVDVDPQMGLLLEFKVTDEQGNMQKLSPETGDLLKLQEVIEEIRNKYDDTEVTPMDPTALGEIALDHLPELG